MKVKFKKEVEADARYLDVKANVRCWDDATVNGIKDEDGGLTAKILGDINAVKRSKIGRRVGRRLAGKLTGRALGKFFR